VDTESNSLHAFREKVCVIQISNPRANYIFDPLWLDDLNLLSGLFADAQIEKIFHGADYDIGLLKRDFGYECYNLFDTMVAAQFLNYERIGLANLINHFYGFQLTKKFTKCNWAQRPLSVEQMVYLCKDTQYLIGLRGHLYKELCERDLIEEANLEFQHIERRQPLEPAYENSTVWEVKGVKSLHNDQFPIAYELFNWRQRQAKKVNLPPFKVINNKTLLELVRARPHNREEIMAITGITMTVWRRYGQELLNAIRRGERRLASKLPQMKSKRGDGQSPVQGDYLKLVDALKKWRSATAQERGIHPLAVLPGYALEVIARQKPQNAEAITVTEGVGEKRAKLYAGDILRIIGEFSENLWHVSENSPPFSIED
jgi:ribonuclease D